ncbi:syntaxin-6 [Eurytemora carolleeae]|uniref:syntaxin-6 n=1 Tax=Eurytemora carolleeae TaxID=1294199 RepID=UPI000C75C0D8|nr:syntaxin-6 [Eurytemora carolleeae]|eukprot:XP_023328820.1 syntaxin-6-like [Eurytemora affinis]
MLFFSGESLKMSLEDPFFVVKDEVTKALEKTRDLFARWRGWGEGGAEHRSNEEEEWTITELKNSLRSIEWDLEDLEDTVQIVEKNPTKFRIDSGELAVRKGFIESTKEEVKQMKQQINSPENHVQLGVYIIIFREYIVGLEQQNLTIRRQEETIDMMSGSMGTIREMSHHISNELDEQAVMLDEFGAEIEHADSRLDATMKKMSKVLHLSNDRRQWMAIGTISSAIILVLLLLFVL